jgi:protein CpxP
MNEAACPPLEVTMKRVRTLALVVVAGSTLAVGTAAAQGPAGGGRGGRMEMRGPVVRGAALPLRALNLTEAQRQQIRTLTEQHREQNRPLMERLRSAVQAQRQAADATPIDEQAIRLAAQQVADAQAEVTIAEARLRSEILAQLTPEQRAEADKLRAEREGRRVQRRERRP